MNNYIKKFIYEKWTIHRLPLEERIEIVKERVRKDEMSGRANTIYAVVALELYEWEDVAKHFYKLDVEERVREMLGAL